MSADILEQMRAGFRAEAMELLLELDETLLALESNPSEQELVHRAFRAIHTIKGSGGTAGFERLAGFAHRVEEAFDLARAGKLALSPELIDCALQSCDVIRVLLENPENTEDARERRVLDTLAGLLPNSQAPTAQATTRAQTPTESRIAFEVILRPKRRIFYSGTDPVTLLEELRELGPARITARTDQVPAISSYEPESCYLWWEILLLTQQGESAIRDVFVFVEDDCEILIRRLEDQHSAIALLGAVEPDSLELFEFECEILISTAQAAAGSLATKPEAREHLEELFRSVHTIHGNAKLLVSEVAECGLAGNSPLVLLVKVAHALESILSPFRGASAPSPDTETIQTSLEGCELLCLLFDGVARYVNAVPIDSGLAARLSLQLDAPPSTGRVDAQRAAFLNTASQCLDVIGDCLQLLQHPDVPAADTLETYHRGLKTLSAAATYQKYTDLEDPIACQLQILDTALRATNTLTPEEKQRLNQAYSSACVVVDTIRANRTSADSGGSQEVQASLPADTMEKRTAAGSSPASTSTIRIDQEKLDRLMRVVGELLVARGAFPVLLSKLQNGVAAASIARDLKDTGASISRIAEELQASVMSVRMLPMKSVFQKFPRLVRDIAHDQGKEVQLNIEGEGTELDKTIIEKIGDPLVHLIRNAVDHGLETPQERTRKGKSPAGRMTLRASTRAGAVVIEVIDDGRGLDTAALKRKVIERGLMTPEAVESMTEMAAFQLVFLPGLSTASTVTNISGRGVGMDVVKNNVANLHGSIDIQSHCDQGTSFSITLPTSLMVSKGILLEAGGEEFILPLNSIRDMVKVPFASFHQYTGMQIAQIRGRVYPISILADVFSLPAKQTAEVPVAIVETGNSAYGLAVDRFAGEVEVLVKPLAGGLESCRQFQGAAIMGDGRVVLVLNPDECRA